MRNVGRAFLAVREIPVVDGVPLLCSQDVGQLA
jgi:hypothetical protein